MNETTLSKMKQMKLHGMHGAFKTAIETGRTDDYTLDEFTALLTDAEWDDRHNRRIDRGIKNARFRYNASMEKVIYDPERNIEKTKLIRLAECTFIEKAEDILITGSTGTGKSYLATALGYQACIEGYRVNLVFSMFLSGS
jgi:DNA replication protein DnaC